MRSACKIRRRQLQTPANLFVVAARRFVDSVGRWVADVTIAHIPEHWRSVRTQASPETHCQSCDPIDILDAWPCRGAGVCDCAVHCRWRVESGCTGMLQWQSQRWCLWPGRRMSCVRIACPMAFIHCVAEILDVDRDAEIADRNVLGHHGLSPPVRLHLA